MVDDAFALLTHECTKELEMLGALREFMGMMCLRLGTGRRFTGDEGFGREDKEFLIRSDGQLLCKTCIRTADKSGVLWEYQIAGGGFSLLDCSTCFIEVQWKYWAIAKGHQMQEDPLELNPWDAVEVDEETAPHHLVPGGPADQINVLHVAKDWLKDYLWMDEFTDIDKNPLAGLPMPGPNADVLGN